MVSNLNCPGCGAGDMEVCKVGCSWPTHDLPNYLYSIPLKVEYACKHNASGKEPCKLCCDEIEVTPAGGKHTKLKTRCDLLPPRALLEIGEVLQKGSHYGVNNWRLIPQERQINHALTHILEYMVHERREDLANAATRLLFALEVDRETTGAWAGPPEYVTLVPEKA